MFLFSMQINRSSLHTYNVNICGSSRYFVRKLSMIFLFKQKKAYEMRISDWSSDVCSSDLLDGSVGALIDRYQTDPVTKEVVSETVTVDQMHHQIGRASCRERVCQYV